MKFLSTTTLALALATGVASVAMLTPQAAIAAKKEKAPEIKLSEGVRKSLLEAQTAQKANDNTTAAATIAEARAAAQTDDDRFYINQMSYEVSKALNDPKAQQIAIDGMLQSGKVPEANQTVYYLALGQLAYNNKDFPKADQALSQAIKMNVSDPAAYALLAETKNQLGRPAEAVTIIQQAADAGEAKGTPIPEEWFARGMSIGAQAKLGAPVAKLSQSWLKAYSTQSHWRDALLIYRDSHQLDADAQLDLMRLQRAANALRGERDYIELAEATQLRFPNEAKTLLDQGISAGVLNQSRSAKELQGITAGKIAADRKSLNKNAANGKSALGTADAYASYGDYASAIELYRKALTLGGVDPNVVNTRLGAALALSGQKDEAKKTFASITGPRADLAGFWTIFIDRPPTA